MKSVFAIFTILLISIIATADEFPVVCIYQHNANAAGPLVDRTLVVEHLENHKLRFTVRTQGGYDSITVQDQLQLQNETNPSAPWHHSFSYSGVEHIDQNLSKNLFLSGENFRIQVLNSNNESRLISCTGYNLTQQVIEAATN